MPEQIITAAITAIVTLISAWLVYKAAKRTGRAQEITAEAAQVNATVEHAASASGEWQKLYQEMRTRLDRLEERLDLAEKRADTAERQADQLTKELDAVFIWIESGMTPPPPARPHYLKGTA
ncbi:hypothetical protein [Gulosibacter massiliensis]|uniref:hypothetical protein n=1 Tax=Gulosibacter massiliensis TaxID=2479839 RepID=UPI000F644265|nr:hypothetical protein [Gulosibacter massiliensis]